MKKAWLSLLLAAAMCVSLLAGCNKDPGSSSSSGGSGGSAEANVSAPGEFPLTPEKVTLKVFYAPVNYITDMEDNQATKWLEEKTNVHVEWMLVTADAAERINLLLATNAEKDMPDVFLASIGRSQVEAYGCLLYTSRCV